MKIAVPGFPSEVSETVETPDMAELLSYPMFRRASPELVLKYGSDWQRMMVSKLPFRHDRRYAHITTFVQVEAPGYRTLTRPERPTTAPDMGWHIDGMTPGDHLEACERVFLFQTECSCLTQFNAVAIELDLPEAVAASKVALVEHLVKRGALSGRPAPAGRIVTFTNHVHRAVVPTGLEFRAIVRARESDVEPPVPDRQARLESVWTWDIARQEAVTVVDRSDGTTRIHFPDHVRGSALEPTEP